MKVGSVQEASLSARSVLPALHRQTPTDTPGRVSCFPNVGRVGTGSLSPCHHVGRPPHSHAHRGQSALSCHTPGGAERLKTPGQHLHRAECGAGDGVSPPCSWVG